ncbi:MAG: hypothetical protein IT428_21655 [Planctomycetaceae bacterium]|nr:hypothetical protein [Planctomycetaceae bacterium]
MASELPVLQPLSTEAAPCRQLLSKGLFINARLPKGEQIVGNGNFWCNKTQATYGPDARLCDGNECRNEARGCYES